MIFVSVAVYALARRLGLEIASAEFMRQVRVAAEELGAQRDTPIMKSSQPAPPGVHIPAAWTVARVALLDQVAINVSAGATVIAKARTLAAHEFLASACDVWVSVDDDIDVSPETLETMIAQVRQDPKCVVVAPCLLRDQDVANIEPSLVAFETKAPTGGKLQQVASAGFGCVAMSRAALEAVAAVLPDVKWTGPDGVERQVLFRDEIERGAWYTEDTAFFRAAKRAKLTAYAARVGTTNHNGQLLDCATLEALVPK